MRSLQTTRNAAFKAAMLAGSAGIIALAQPALAQDTGAPVKTNEPVQTSPSEPQGSTVTDQSNQPGIVVTGSRIVKKDFESNSPIVTVDQSLLSQSSTAAIEQNLNKLPQFTPSKTPTAGGDIQPTATNTPGSATISLRGIGANRSLVLIDGRRATPGNATGVVDITTIPSAAVERVEIISGGASATYGADAVAGVTNFIMKKNFQGLELDGRAGLAEEGDAFEYEISGIMGADFADGRGNVSVALSTNKREASYQNNRDFYRKLWTNPNTPATGFFFPAAGVNLGFGNLPTDLGTLFPGATPPVPAAGTVVFFNPDGSPFTGNTFGTRGGAAFLDAPTDGRPYKKMANGVLGANDDYLYNVLPLTRYNMYMRGNYEINDWIGVFGQGLFSHVHTHTLQEPGPIVGGWGVIIDPTKLTHDQLPQTMWDLLNSRDLDGPGPLPAGSGANAPFSMQALMPAPRETDTDVDTFNITAGLQGSVPGTDWTWEIFSNHGESSTFANQTGIYSLSRVRAVMGAPNFGAGFKSQGNAAFGGFGASTATCTSGLNFFNPPAGGFSKDCIEAISADLKNRSKVKQSIWEANATGSLFELPAGPLQAAVGASYRDTHYTFLNDTLTTQGRSFQDQALGIYPSGNSTGDITVKEVYGELAVPILKDSFIKSFNLELGGRISDYSTTGTSYTYKALADIAINDWIRFRGGYNRAERAPNIAELFLAPQQTFGVNTAGDVCSINNPLSFSANPASNPTNAANVKAVCEVLMDQTGNPNAKTQFYGNPGLQSNSTFGFAFPTLVGNGNLHPEKADTWTAGVVLSSPFETPALSRLRLSVDWYSIKVSDAIGPQSIRIALQQCFDVNLNPLVATDATAAANSPFCQHVPRNADQGVLGNVTTTYVNNGRFKTDGIDAQLDWGMDVGPGTFSTNVIFNYLLHFKSSGLPTNPMLDYAGTFGTVDNGLNGAAYRWKMLANFGYKWGPASLGLQWQHLPSIEDSAEPTIPGGTPTTGAPAYDLFELSGSYDVTDNFTIRAGVENLFDKSPPLTGINTANTTPATNALLPGGSFNSTYYDTLGRRFYVGANMKF